MGKRNGREKEAPAHRRACSGRKKIIDLLASLASGGETVLVYGPRGIGKSTIISQVARKVRAAGRPCAVWPETEMFRDVVFGLSEIYPHVQIEGKNHRQLRNAFRLSIEAEPGVLLLDHFREAGTALKGFLRYLRHSGLGILIAADADHARDHHRLRRARLTHREVAVPPLTIPLLRKVFQDALGPIQLPHVLDESSLLAVLETARGRPGMIQPIIHRLASPRYWSNGEVLPDLLGVDVAMDAFQWAPGKRQG